MAALGGGAFSVLGGDNVTQLSDSDGTSSWEIEESKEWILNQEDYPHLNKFRGWYGYGWEYIIKELLSDGHIILDDNVIIYTGINSPKLQRLVDESVMLS